MCSDLHEFEPFFELQMQGHHITGSISVFALFSFLFSSVMQPGDIIRLHGTVAMRNLKVFFSSLIFHSQQERNRARKQKSFLSGRSSKEFFLLEPLHYHAVSCHFLSFAKGTAPEILKCYYCFPERCIFKHIIVRKIECS